ncbi:hypothetical protein DPMN_191399 [Dreissena polymorpha]|uniref:Uncharacterized protein n=1 Tax=Dreissena polymorpha TaxID=45954 RepID=A0A9D4BE70_DREPO|nr:hypothetical protein DPMN_191399 [Dreissena polymorpha]
MLQEKVWNACHQMISPPFDVVGIAAGEHCIHLLLTSALVLRMLCQRVQDPGNSASDRVVVCDKCFEL